MNLDNPMINQHTVLTDGSVFKPGESFVGNPGFFSAETCNKISYENAKSNSATTASLKATASNLAKYAKQKGESIASLPAVCNSLGIKIDPTIVNMSIDGAKID